MSLLAALVRAYGRMDGAPPFGFSTERIGYVVLLSENGTATHAVPLGDGNKKRTSQPMTVPQAVKRASGIAPNFLWDKTAYVLGVTAGENRRTAQEHGAFRKRHSEWLAGTNDAGLLALLRFLDGWTPEMFQPPNWPEEMRDQNVVFALETDWLEGVFLHDRPAARAAWARVVGAAASGPRMCPVAGEPGPVARLHPSIKGVWGAQSSGASLVSYNCDAFESYGHTQGDNAQMSEAATFAYTTALNRLLDQEHGQRIQIGDASTVFWAEGRSEEDARAAVAMFNAFWGGEVTKEQVARGMEKDDTLQAKRVHERLASIRDGRPLVEVEPALAKDVRFFVLGLAPNAARLAVRFYVEDTFGAITASYQRYVADMAIEPPPQGQPSLWRYLVELAVQGKRENIPPTLAGAWMRAILTGTPYPMTLLSTALMRIRADSTVNGLRAAILRAILVRNRNMEVPVALDPDNRNKGYLLGRLFAVYEGIQRAALGKVNASIQNKFYGAASATPQKVFALLDRGSANHLGRIRKEKPGLEYALRRKIATIMEMMAPGDTPYPAALSAEEQALFGLGYYHQSPLPRAKDETPAETGKIK